MKKKSKVVTATLITTIAAILCVAILVTVIYHYDWFASPSSSTSMIVSEITETIVVDQSTLEETPSTESTPQETSSEIHSQSTSQPSTSTSPTKTDASKVKINDSTGIVFADESTTCLIKGIGAVPIREAYEKGYIRIKIINGLAYSVHTMNGVDYVCEANPDTGISYDGESPIIYTYPDGTTGTECRDGATYEWLPGMERTIMFPKDGNGRIEGTICEQCGKPVGRGSDPSKCKQFSKSTYCSHCGEYVTANSCHYCRVSGEYYCNVCGRPGGNGSNGTCVRYWTGGDHTCECCGATIPVETCHTCSEYDKPRFCSVCGKPYGNGTNGTCVRWLMSDIDCPNCGKYVKVYTCHTCDE